MQQTGWAVVRFFGLKALEAGVTLRHGLIAVAADFDDPVVSVDLEARAAATGAKAAEGLHFPNAIAVHVRPPCVPPPREWAEAPGIATRI
jgi:hypothetical protein